MVYRKKDGQAQIKVAPYQRAADCLGEITPGCRLFGFTKGQFSLLDLIQAILAQTGNADLIISPWTTGIRDAENADALLKKGVIRSLILLTDRSFPSRQPQYCQRILEIFGRDSISCTRTHAKFALIQNDTWNIAVRSSMNLNRNPRFEQFDLDDDPALCAFMREHVDEIRRDTPLGFDFVTAEIDKAFAQALGGGLSEVYSLDDETGAKTEIHARNRGKDTKCATDWGNSQGGVWGGGHRA